MNALPIVCDRIVQWGLAALIAFTPLAFGTVEPWSIALMEWGIFTLSLVFLLGRLWSTGGSPWGRVRWSGLELPLGLFLLFCALQTAPLSSTWLHRLSPGSANLYFKVGDSSSWRALEAKERDAASGRDLRLPLVEPLRRPISVQPAKTWNRMELCMAFGILCLFVALWADRSERILFLFGTVTIVGFLVALEGLIQSLTWNGKIYGIRNVPQSSVFGPFVNHNHFAGYVEMVIPVTVSLAFYFVEIQWRSGWPLTTLRFFAASPGTSPGGPGEGSRTKAGLAIFAAVLLVVTLFLSLSRGGIVSATLGGLLLFALVWRRISSRRARWSMAVTLPVAALALIAWIGAGAIQHQLGTLQKLEGETSFRFRRLIWETVLEKFSNFAWFGSGLGTFEDSFAPYTPPGNSRRWDKAHNDYLQFLWETGVVGMSLFLYGAFVFVRRYWWPAILSRARPLDLFRVGAAIALASIALHSLVDFNLQIGANGFLCALLAGLLVAMDRTGLYQGVIRPVVVNDREPSD